MDRKMDDEELEAYLKIEALILDALVDLGLQSETADFFRMMSVLNNKPALIFLIDAAEGFREYLEQDPEMGEEDQDQDQEVQYILNLEKPKTVH